MSAGDRGGVAELIRIIKQTRVPIICICNDLFSDKVKSLKNHCLDMRFQRPPAQLCRPRLLQIAKAEGLTIQPETVGATSGSCLTPGAGSGRGDDSLTGGPSQRDHDAAVLAFSVVDAQVGRCEGVRRLYPMSVLTTAAQCRRAGRMGR